MFVRKIYGNVRGLRGHNGEMRKRKKPPSDVCKCGEKKLASSKLCLECSTAQKKKVGKKARQHKEKKAMENDIKLIKYQCPECSEMNKDFVCRGIMMECYCCGFQWNGDYVW